MTEMGKLGWSDPLKADPMLKNIPVGKFAGNYWLTLQLAQFLIKLLLMFWILTRLQKWKMW